MNTAIAMTTAVLVTLCVAASAPAAESVARQHGDRDAILHAQVLLDRAGFSVGEIDGRWARSTAAGATTPNGRSALFSVRAAWR